MENRAFEVTALDATPLELGPKDFSAVRPAGDAQYVGHRTSGQFWESRDCGELPAGFMQTYRVPRLQDGSLGRTSAAAAQAAPEPDDAAAEDPTPSSYHNSRIWYPPVRKRAFYDNAVRLYQDARRAAGASRWQPIPELGAFVVGTGGGTYRMYGYFMSKQAVYNALDGQSWRIEYGIHKGDRWAVFVESEIRVEVYIGYQQNDSLREMDGLIVAGKKGWPKHEDLLARVVQVLLEWYQKHGEC